MFAQPLRVDDRGLLVRDELLVDSRACGVREKVPAW